MVWRCHELYPPNPAKEKTAYAVLHYKPYQYCILCCCQFLTAILLIAMQLYYLAHCKPHTSFAKSQSQTTSIAIKSQSFQPPPPFLYCSTKIARSILKHKVSLCNFFTYPYPPRRMLNKKNHIITLC